MPSASHGENEYLYTLDKTSNDEYKVEKKTGRSLDDLGWHLPAFQALTDDHRHFLQSADPGNALGGHRFPDLLLQSIDCQD